MLPDIEPLGFDISWEQMPYHHPKQIRQAAPAIPGGIQRFPEMALAGGGVTNGAKQTSLPWLLSSGAPASWGTFLKTLDAKASPSALVICPAVGANITGYILRLWSSQPSLFTKGGKVGGIHLAAGAEWVVFDIRIGIQLHAKNFAQLLPGLKKHEGLIAVISRTEITVTEEFYPWPPWATSPHHQKCRIWLSR